MNKKTLNKIVKVAESLDWSVTVNNNEFEFEKYSPAGHDFNLNVTTDSIEELIDKLQDRYDDFDCSEETYLWLDHSGHGTNGAPYDMKDVYEDMEACQDMILGLHNAIVEKNKWKQKK